MYQILALPVFEKIVSDFVTSLQNHPFDSGAEMLQVRPRPRFLVPRSPVTTRIRITHP